jgi:hypothetical protein
VLERKKEMFEKMNSQYKEQKAKQEMVLKAIQEKISRTDTDKENLEEKKSDTSKQMISDETYDQIA